MFTAALAERCDRLLAVEPVALALAAAEARNREKPWVRFAPAFIPQDWPRERFDLVVMSEVLDYLGAADVAEVGARLRESLQPGGDVVLVHWVGKKKGGSAKPSEASEVLIAAAVDYLRPVFQTRNADYRLDVLRRVD